LLADLPDADVVGQVAVAADLMAQLAAYQPEVVVWDMGWDMDRGAPRTPLDDLVEVCESGYAVLVLLSDDAHLSAVWTAGARGVLRRDHAADTLAAALVAVQRGLVVLTPEFATAQLTLRAAAASAPGEAPTPRERDVLHLLAEGLPNKTIADRLAISEHTVKFHVNALMGKLGAQSRTEAVVRAIRLGWLAL
jgi:DNA-binding NarL/FixJ family response regulator